MTAYRYVIEQVAAEAVLALGVRDRRLLHAVFEDLARHPFQTADFTETARDGRPLFTRFVGPYSVTYVLDHAVREVRIVLVRQD